MSQFKSSHDLKFEVAPWERSTEFQRYRVGTCTGLWNQEGSDFNILAIENEVKGNGHFEDVLEWFENSCKTYNMNLRILDIMNQRLEIHLLNKRGFIRELGVDTNVIKYFKK